MAAELPGRTRPGHSAELGALPLPGASPREIRAALHPEDRDDFNWDFQAALAEAGRSLDLTGVQEMLEHWRYRCWITRDKQQFRRVVRAAVENLTGQEAPADEPVAVTEAKLRSLRRTRRATAKAGTAAKV